MHNPQLSVIMSCYNCVGTVEAAIDSILEQTFTDYEFIIIDDGSSDGTLEVVQEYAKKDDRIRVLMNSENMGLAASLNKGIKAATSPLIARMDADDTSVKDRLFKQVEFLKDHPDVGILGAGIVQKSKAGKILDNRFLPEQHIDIVKNVFRKPLVYHPTIVARKNVYEDFGFYNPDITWAEDADLWYRIYDKVQFHNLQDALLYYTIKDRMTLKQIWYNLKVKIDNLKKRRKFVAFLPILTYDTIVMSLRLIKYSL